MGLLEGKTAIVTGGSRGLGKAIAELFGAEGAFVVVIDLKEQWAQKTADLIIQGRGSAVGFGADVSDRESMFDCVNRTVQKFGALDIVVNNAMWNRYEPIDAIEPETVQRMVGVGFEAIIWSIQSAASVMRERGGSIVNIGSSAGALGVPNALVYCGVKAGVAGLTRSASVELGPHKIRVNSIAPSTVATEGVKAMLTEEAFELRLSKTPLKRLGEVADIAETALWLASDKASFITGQTITVDGGISHAFL